MSSAHVQAAAEVKPEKPEAEPENEWTIMVFFAGDSRLTTSMTEQLKALKDAGFQDNTTVLVHYDPNERGVGTTTFEINRERKAQIRENHQTATRIGDGKDPFVRNLLEDSTNGVAKSATAAQALNRFLINGLRKHPAKHYIVFLVGHGVIVGNDFFLPDIHPESGITLKQLGTIMSDFQKGAKIMKDGAVVEMIGLHSCSMSAVEVAYELQGTARYMLATQGASFVSSWPYRQLLKKILNTIDVSKKSKKPVNIDDLITSLQQLALHNSTDFMFSGLSADICLSSLEPGRVTGLTTPIQKLVKALKDGLKDPRGLELINLAHLKSQSYFQESYTDLYDFCLCLENQCDKNKPVQEAMAKACYDVKLKLKESPNDVIVQSDFFGPRFQYSHGLSIFFPWSKPVDDLPLNGQDDMLGRYRKYAFSEAFKDDSWLSFLTDYFTATLRKSRMVEDGRVQENGRKVSANSSTTVNGGSAASNGSGSDDVLAGPDKPSSTLDKPSSGLDKPSSGLNLPLLVDDGCGCSVKNYPMQFSIRSPRAAEDYNAEAMAKTAEPEPRPQPSLART